MIGKGDHVLLGGLKFRATSRQSGVPGSVALVGVPTRSGRKSHVGHSFYLYVKFLGGRRSYVLSTATSKGAPGFMGSDESHQYSDVDVVLLPARIVEAVDQLLRETPDSLGTSAPHGTSAMPGLYFHRSNDERDWRSSLQMDFEHIQPGQEFRIDAARIFIREVHHLRALGYDPESREPRILTYDVETDTARLSDRNGKVIATSKLLAL